jgi:hypothetical protein
MENEKPESNQKERARPPAKSRPHYPAQRKGFYAQQMKALELHDLDTALTTGLQDEIAMLRVLARRMFEYANAAEPEDVKEWAALVGALGTVSTRIAVLLRAEKSLAGGEANPIAAALSEALVSIRKEWRIK